MNYFDEKELAERICKNRERIFNGEEYSVNKLFREPSYTWYGDFEGRSLLAFTCHARLGKETSRMSEMYSLLEEKTDGNLFFGRPTGDKGAPISEQQLSGHSWYLRGLCEHYELFGDRLSLDALRETFRYIYLPMLEKIDMYPISNRAEVGGVSGEDADIKSGWLLSTDVGCVVMSLDGLSHYYKLTSDSRAKDICDKLAGLLDRVDVEGLKMQTHCTLTAGRGLVRLYEMTSDKRYLELAKRILKLYVKSGMTCTYQNLNWWGRPDSWTEPCAIVDSLMLSGQLFEQTGNTDYRHLAARIWHNGFATLQRPNGGAGTDTIVNSNQPILKAKMYEAWFCCSMRLAEGLLYANSHKELLGAELSGRPTKDSLGRYMDGDILYALVPEEYRMNAAATPDGELSPILKLYKFKTEDISQIEQRIVF